MNIDVAAEGTECLLILDDDTEGKIHRGILNYERLLELAPDRCQAHRSRVLLLIVADRAQDAVTAVERALAACKTAGPSEWTPIAALLFERGLAEEALAASKLLEKRWPRDPEVLGAKGSALAVLERDDEALIYLRAAAEYAPSNSVHRWNLARLLAYMGLNDEASREFATWSSLEKDRDRLMRNSCIFAGFVEKQVGDRARACMLQQEFCPEPSRSACVPLPAPTESAP